MLRPLLLALSALAWRGVALLALALTSGAALAAPAFPPLTGRVVDEAQILSPQSTAEIAAKLNALEAKPRPACRVHRQVAARLCH